MNDTRTPPEIEIRRLIKERGRISFAEFTNVALYHPEGGYYTSPFAFGSSGDYYTSATAHPAFGTLLATQFHQMWRLLGRPKPFFVVELGAGSGQLSSDIIEFSIGLNQEFHESLRYVAIDRYAANTNQSPVIQSCLQPIIAENIPLRNMVGCVISNELIDSFPFHRFQVDDGEIKEVFVSLDDHDNFVEILDSPSTPDIPDRLDQLGLSLPDGHQGEVNLNIRPWLNQVSDALERGFVITIDYGFEASELYSTNRPQGTFDTFYRHTRGASPYQRIGRQDITAHVDFSLMMSEGEGVGLNTVAFLTQAEYLERLGFSHMRNLLRGRNLSHRELQANTMGMLELVKPDGFGAFKVLIQEKGTGVGDVEEVTKVKSPTGVPLLKTDHTPLFEGRYPHQTWDMDSLWPFEDRPSES